MNECQNIISLRKDTNLISRVKPEDKADSNVKKIDFTNKKYHKQRQTQKPEQNATPDSQGQNAKPSSPCGFVE